MLNQNTLPTNEPLKKKNSRSLFKITLIILGVLIVLGFVVYETIDVIPKLPKNTNLQLPEQWKVCQQDSDCAETQEGCCSCNNGGKQTAINKKYLKQWENVLKNRCDVDCPSVFVCRKGKSVCRNNRCEFKYSNLTQNNTKEEMGLVLLTNNIPENWDWDSGQDCYGLTSPEQCKKINWPMGCKNCGCRKAEIEDCYECLAEKKEDPSICEKINFDDKKKQNFWRDDCYWRLVIKFRNEGKIDRINFCDKFVEAGHKKACYDIVNEF